MDGDCSFRDLKLSDEFDEINSCIPYMYWCFFKIEI